MKKIYILFLITNSVLIAKTSYKYSAYIEPAKINYIYSDINGIVKKINTNSIHDYVEKPTIVVQYEDNEEQLKLKSLEKKLKKEMKKIVFLSEEIELKQKLLKKIKEKLNQSNKLKPVFSREDIEDIRSDIYFYEREIYRYNIDYIYFDKKFKNLKKVADDIRKKINQKKIKVSNAYVDEIFVKEGQSVFKYDKLIKYFSLNNLYLKIKLSKKDYEDMLNYYLDVIVFHNTISIEPDSIKLDKKNGYLLIIKLSNISKYFIKDKLEVLIRKQGKIKRNIIN